MEVTISAGALSMLLLEGIKQLIKRFGKNPDFNFEPWVFAVVIPVLNALMPFVFVFVLGMGSTDPILTMTWQGILQYILKVAVASLISFFAYDNGLKPLKTYSNKVKLAKANKQ